ncbi:MAG: bifunctional (p)ppGpp synthetase/guanosine-3',5'-bis(diphosphate) 3'-pyrophosphohydrolase [Acidimicrobiales bacterium]|nr:bifunctional (p)ppGpp synthetase/guanosine-3',5'-bis(diphosphate) 3'-pyrophosphohydrolase [Acidimicrobiales bacterium]
MLLEAFAKRHPGQPTGLIEQAIKLATTAHDGQMRKSGEAYIHHPIAVATIVAQLGLDDISVAAAVLHDTAEDTSITIDQIADQLGLDVSRIVDGVTKLERIKFDSKEHQQAATMRKMLVAVAQDVRVLIIKLADRLHNMRTIAAMPSWKQERTANETIDIYAPLAHRLGMQDLRQQLEDLGFAAAHPKTYAQIDRMVAQRDPEREVLLAQVLGDIETRLVELGINATVTGRPKHLYSIWEKMQVKGRPFDEIYDLVGVRVVVKNVRDCYAALGSIHATWKPVQGRFKDYIAMPKFNLYQSLHTTVVGPQGTPLEVQIRTEEMDHRAEGGVAAHYEYKDSSEAGEMAWLNRIVDWQQETEDPSTFMANLKVDLENDDEVFVFTPKGEVVSLPVGATPVDFAYAIHTEVGHTCIGVRINGRLVALDSRLQSGDTLEVFTSKVSGAGPSKDWLKFVVTHRAANKIRQWHSRERREDAIEEGRNAYKDALRAQGLPVKKLLTNESITSICDAMNYADADTLWAAIGKGDVAVDTVVGAVERALRDGHEPTGVQMPPAISNRPRRRGSNSSGVHVEGLDDVMIRLSRCCTPVPPDEIIGFVTRGRGVSVHRTDCANARELMAGHAERLMDVEWTADHAGEFVTTIEVKSLDRPHLLADIARIVADNRLNILAADTDTGRDRVSRMRFEIELGDVNHLQQLLSEIRDIDHVFDAYRIMPGGAAKPPTEADLSTS